MSESILEFIQPNTDFDVVEDHKMQTNANFDILSDCSESSAHGVSYTMTADEMEAIAQLQKELSSPSSYYEESSPILYHAASPGLGLKVAPESPSNYMDSSLDIVMKSADGETEAVSTPSSPESCRSPSPHLITTSSSSSNKAPAIQILKDLDVKVREDQLVNMKIGELSKVAGIKFTKNEEKEIKRLRRKIKNKLSAAQSRQKMKDYVSGLEERVEVVTQLNLQLKQKVSELEEENKKLKDKVRAFSSSSDNSNSNTNSSASTSSSAASSPTANAVGSSTENSLLRDSHGSKSNKKRTGIYIMMVFLSFGLFYGISNNFENGKIPPVDTFTSPASSSQEAAQSFVSRNILFYDNEIFMMDTEPMREQSGVNNDSEDSFWDAYYRSEMSSFSTIDRTHDVVITGHPPMCSEKTIYSVNTNDAQLCSSASLYAAKIKNALENLSYVDKVYCGDSFCLVRLDQEHTVI